MAVEKYYNEEKTMVGVLIADGVALRCEDRCIRCDKRVIDFFLSNKPEEMTEETVMLFANKFDNFVKTLGYEAALYVNEYDPEIESVLIFDIMWVPVGAKFKISNDSDVYDEGCSWHLYEYIEIFNEEDWLVA